MSGFRGLLASPSISLALLLASALPADALDPNLKLSQYIHRIWQTQPNLPQADFYSLGQTTDGYLLLGTQTGLLRFDGVRFTTFDALTPLENVGIHSILVEPGRLWLGMNGAGLVELRDGQVTRYTQPQGPPSNTEFCVLRYRGDIWACTANGVVRLHDGRLLSYRMEQGLTTNDIRAACEAFDGTLLLGGEDSSLNIWDGRGFKSRKLASAPPEAGVRALVCDPDGSTWVGTTRGLVHIKGQAERLFTTVDGLADNRVLCLAAGHDEVLWVGTQNGFSRVRRGELESFFPEDGLSQRSVYAIREDDEGSLWVGTKHGLNQFLDGRSVPYSIGEGLPSNNAGPVLDDRHGTVWVGTVDKGLARFDGHRFSVLTRTDGLASDSINALAEDAQSGLWVGTAAGITHLIDGHVRESYRSAQGLPSDFVSCLFTDRSGALWAGTAAGPARLANGGFKKVEDAAPLEGPIRAINQDGAGRLYFALDRGVYFVEESALHELISPEGPIRGADAFYRDPEGALWIGMLGGGLTLVRNRRVSCFHARDGLFDVDIYGIVSDHMDRLWMSCSKGIFSVRRSALLDFAAGKIKRLVSTPYTPIDLQHTLECKPGAQPAAWGMKDGRLWFSTIGGAFVFDPRHLSREVAPARVVIEDVMVNGRRNRPSRIATLPPGQNNLEFQYTALSFIDPGQITFRYKLEGFDHNWTEAGARRAAFYTNLPAGTFRFRVTACNIDGLCNPTGSVVQFVLTPHFYQSPWFITFCVGLACLLGWLIHRFRIRQVRQQLGLVMGERNRIARELHDTLIQGFSGITMQMQALAVRLQSPDERAALEDIVRDSGNYLLKTRESVANLRNTQGPRLTLSAAIAATAREITEAVPSVHLELNLTEDTPSDLLPEVYDSLLKIAEEAVSNSVRHSGAQTIVVTLDFTRDGLQLCVKDDGSGFVAGNAGAKPGHYGHIGMMERAVLIGADLQLTSAPGEGTTVSVFVPGLKPALKHLPE